MKTEIITTEYKKKETRKEVNIPEEILYLFFTGIRRAYKITPVWTSWNKEHYQNDEVIWQYEVVSVDPTDKIVKLFNIQVSHMGDVLRKGEGNDRELIRIVEHLIYPDDYAVRTKEQFEVDYNNVIEQFTKAVNP